MTSSSRRENRVHPLELPRSAVYYSPSPPHKRKIPSCPSPLQPPGMTPPRYSQMHQQGQHCLLYPYAQFFIPHKRNFSRSSKTDTILRPVSPAPRNRILRREQFGVTHDLIAPRPQTRSGQQETEQFLLLEEGRCAFPIFL